jgi:hypothetical protein
MTAADPRFFAPPMDTDQPVWGLHDGLRFGIWPGAIGGGGTGGPRGLLRVGYPALPDRGYILVNFIAIEPVVQGQRARGFSELETSATDGRPGKAIEAGPPPGVEWHPTEAQPIHPGQIEELDGGAARLTVCLRVERFASGAHVYLLASVRTDRPDELELQSFTEAGSAPLAACVLTATMGNFERLRQLHLKDRVVTTQELYPDLTGADFAPHKRFALDQLSRASDGSVLVAATTDEPDPAATLPDPNRPWFWRYTGRKLTQYWRKYPDTWQASLAVAVNARRVYWASTWSIPNGIAFENFEFNEPFAQGQATVFGLTALTPEQLVSAP